MRCGAAVCCRSWAPTAGVTMRANCGRANRRVDVCEMGFGPARETEFGPAARSRRAACSRGRTRTRRGAFGFWPLWRAVLGNEFTWPSSILAKRLAYRLCDLIWALRARLRERVRQLQRHLCVPQNRAHQPPACPLPARCTLSAKREARSATPAAASRPPLLPTAAAKSRPSPAPRPQVRRPVFQRIFSDLRPGHKPDISLEKYKTVVKLLAAATVGCQGAKN
jgi:hypothetical protein